MMAAKLKSQTTDVIRFFFNPSNFSSNFQFFQKKNKIKGFILELMPKNIEQNSRKWRLKSRSMKFGEKSSGIYARFNQFLTN